MPLKLNVGLSKKIGQPNYGSLGASCHVEVELDHSLIFDDLEGFQERAMHAFAACRQAVHEQLSRPPVDDNGQDASDQAVGPSVANSHALEHHAPPASQKQLDYAQQLAGQIRGLGAPRLEVLADKLFGKALAELSTVDASELIDLLKDVRTGKIELSAVLNGAAA
jgi:hypothetical protein